MKHVDMLRLFSAAICLLACISIVLFAWTEDAPAQENASLKSAAVQEITLEQAIRMALENNRSLRNAALDVESSDLSLKSQQSQFDIKIVPQGATRYDSDDDGYWQVGATVSKKLTQGPTISVTPTTGESGGSGNSEVDVSLRIPLLQGAGSAYAMDSVYSSAYANKVQQLSYVKQEINTILQTVNAVYQCIKTQQQIAFLENQLAELKKHLSLAKIKEKSGIIDAMDLYRAELRIQDVEEELTTTREELANSIDEVKNQLALSLRQPLIVTAPVEYAPVDIDLEEAQNIALANRIELAMSELQVRETERRVAVAKNNILPQLDLELGYNTYREEDFDELSEERWTVALSSESDLFRTTERNDYQQSKLELQQVQLDRQDAEEQIIQDVRYQLNSLEKQQERIRIREEQSRQALGKLRLAQSKFRYSLANNFDLLEAQTEMQQARTEQMMETVNYIIGTYRLRSSLGTLIDLKDKATVN